MFSKLLKKIKNIINKTEQIDEQFYAKVMDELSVGFRDKALAGKAIAQSEGYEEKFHSIYIKLRAKYLQEEHIWEEQKKALEIKEQKELQYSIKKRLAEGYFEKLFKEEIKKCGYKKVPLSKNKFIKDNKRYYGKIDYEKNKYVLVDENNKYTDGFAFEPI